MAEEKICPLLSIAEKEWMICLEEKCAWWRESWRRCAITDIACSLSR